jgi:uncharacterized protein (TIRG00374 family)
LFGKKTNLLGILISIVCLIIIFGKLDLSQLWSALSNVNISVLAVAVSVFLTTFLVRTWRWQLLLRPTRQVAYRRLFSVVMIGYMANNILPARLGEIVRAYVLNRKEGIRKSSSLATIFIERIFDGLSLLFILGALLLAHQMGWLSMEHAFPASIQWAGLGAGTVFFIAFAGVLTLEFYPPFATLITRLIEQFSPQALRARLLEIVQAFREGVSCVRSLGAMVLVFGGSILIWTIEGITYSLVGQAFALDLPLRAFFITMVIVNLGTLIPSAPGYLGTFQFFCWLSLALFGMSKEMAVSYGLVLNVMEYLPVTLLGILFLLSENVSLQSLLRRNNEEEAAGPATHGAR